MTVVVNELEVQPAGDDRPGAAPAAAPAPAPQDGKAESRALRAVQQRAERRHRLEAY